MASEHTTQYTAEHTAERTTPHDRPTSTADLVNQAAAQVSTLVRDELALAKAELAAFAGAGIAASVGKKQIARALPPVPGEAAAGLGSDLDTVKNAVQEGRHS